MIERTITSINWLVGTLALGGAILYPFVREVFDVNASKLEIEKTAQLMIQAETRHLSLRQRYVYFAANRPSMDRAARELDLGPIGGDFLFEASAEPGKVLVIRAYTSPAAIEAGRRPPLMYRNEITQPGSEGKPEWVKLSGHSRN
jgi:hypothetical protein